MFLTVHAWREKQIQQFHSAVIYGIWSFNGRLRGTSVCESVFVFFSLSAMSAVYYACPSTAAWCLGFKALACLCKVKRIAVPPGWPCEPLLSSLSIGGGGGGSSSDGSVTHGVLNPPPPQSPSATQALCMQRHLPIIPNKSAFLC